MRGWLVGGALCVAAVARALVAAPAPSPAPAVSREVEHEIWRELVSKEPELRAKAVADFPSHRWSQEDGFGADARGFARELAARHRLTEQAVHRIFDEGLREGWPVPEGVPRPRSTVERFSPRPFD